MRFLPGLVVIARAKHPIPSRTRPLSAVAPMVLRLKTWESRSPPNLARNINLSIRKIPKSPDIQWMPGFLRPKPWKIQHKLPIKPDAPNITMVHGLCGGSSRRWSPAPAAERTGRRQSRRVGHRGRLLFASRTCDPKFEQDHRVAGLN